MAANDVDELRQRVGRELTGIAGLLDVLLAEAEQDGYHLGAAITLAVQVDRLARRYGDPGHTETETIPPGPWDTRIRAALHGIDAHQFHLKRLRKAAERAGRS